MFKLFLDFLPLILLLVINAWVIYKSALQQAKTRQELESFHRMLKTTVGKLESILKRNSHDRRKRPKCNV